MPFLVVVPFVVVVTGFVALALAAMAQSQASAYHSWLDGYLGRVGSIISVPLTAALDLARWITRKLGDHFAGIERLTVGWIAGVFQYAATVITFALIWPYELFKFAFWLLDKEIPRLIHALPTKAGQVIHSVQTRVVRVEKTVVQFPKLSRATARHLVEAAIAGLVAPYLLPLRWLRAHFHALTAVLPHTLPIPFGRTIAGIRARLRRLERVTAGGLAIGVLVAALARLGMGFLRCGNVKKVGRSVCRTDAGLLDSLLLDTLALGSIISVVSFARELRAIESEAVTIMGKLVREFPSA